MLCYKCAGNAFIQNLGRCKSCGTTTSSGAFKLCGKCAKAKNECAACGGKLNAVKPPVDPNAKSLHILGVDHDHYRGGQPPASGVAVIAESTAAIASFKKDLAAWLSVQNLPSDAVEITNELNALGILFVNCTSATADALKAMPGVASITANQ